MTKRWIPMRLDSGVRIPYAPQTKKHENRDSKLYSRCTNTACRADPSDVKTNESLRLLKSDITKINRLKNEKSKRKTEEEK